MYYLCYQLHVYSLDMITNGFFILAVSICLNYLSFLAPIFIRVHVYFECTCQIFVYLILICTHAHLHDVQYSVHACIRRSDPYYLILPFSSEYV